MNCVHCDGAVTNKDYWYYTDRLPIHTACIGYADDAVSCGSSLTNPVIQYRLNIPDNDLIFNQDIYLTVPVNKYPFIQIDGLYNWEVSAVGIDK